MAGRAAPAWAQAQRPRCQKEDAGAPSFAPGPQPQVTNTSAPSHPAAPSARDGAPRQRRCRRWRSGGGSTLASSPGALSRPAPGNQPWRRGSGAVQACSHCSAKVAVLPVAQHLAWCQPRWGFVVVEWRWSPPLLRHPGSSRQRRVRAVTTINESFFDVGDDSAGGECTARLGMVTFNDATD